MLLQFVLFRGAKNYNEIKQACVAYCDNQKMIDAPVTNDETKGVRFTVQSKPKDSRIYDLCKQVENLHLMVRKRPGQHEKVSLCPINVTRKDIEPRNVAPDKSPGVNDATSKVIMQVNAR